MARALRVKRGDVVSFVGGGGKTTSMFRLAKELSKAGLRVLTTTTTHISEEQAGFAPAFIRPDEISYLSHCLDQFGQCLLVGPPDGKGRVLSITPDMISVLKTRPDIDCILVEADGSKSRPFKAPGTHEPVVPPVTTVLVPIMGLNSMGRPLDDRTVHRPEIVASLADSRIGDPITPETVARVLSHVDGGAKNLPAGARLVPLINRVDTGDFRVAADIAGKLLRYSNVDSVVAGSMNSEPPVREVWIPTAGIITAAGEDADLVARTVRAAADAGLDPVIVVLGRESEKVSMSLEGLPVRFVIHPGRADGPGSAVRAGIGALPDRAGAALVFFAAMPRIDAGMIGAVLQARRKTLAQVCIAEFEGKREDLVLFDRSLFAELQGLRGETGLREMLDRHQDAIETVPVG